VAADQAPGGPKSELSDHPDFLAQPLRQLDAPKSHILSESERFELLFKKLSIKFGRG
jgi:hypothetical protein